MKNHFIIPYFGNKRMETKYFINDILKNISEILKNSDEIFIIEPYCGSCAITFEIWERIKNIEDYKNKKINYILNDNNKYLIELLNILKNDNLILEFDENIKNIINKLKNECLITYKINYVNYLKENDDIYSYYIKNKYYYIRPGLFPTSRIYQLDNLKSLKTYPIYNFIKNNNIILKNLDGLDIYEQYKNIDNSIIFLDPPYTLSCNDSYLNKLDKNNNIYEYFYYNKIEEQKANIYLILEDNFIINILFKNLDIIKYDKLYQNTKRKTKHLIIYNKKNLTL